MDRKQRRNPRNGLVINELSIAVRYHLFRLHGWMSTSW